MGRQYLLYRPHRAAEKPRRSGGNASDLHHLPVRHRHRAGGAEHPAVPEAEPGGSFPGAGHFLHHRGNYLRDPGTGSHRRRPGSKAGRPCWLHHGFAGSPQGGGHHSRGRRPVPARDLRQKHPLGSLHFLRGQPEHFLWHRRGDLLRRISRDQLSRHQRCQGDHRAAHRRPDLHRPIRRL